MPSPRPSLRGLGEGERTGRDSGVGDDHFVRRGKIPGGNKISSPAGWGSFFVEREGSPAPPDQRGPRIFEQEVTEATEVRLRGSSPSVTSVASCAKLDSGDGRLRPWDGTGSWDGTRSLHRDAACPIARQVGTTKSPRAPRKPRCWDNFAERQLVPIQRLFANRLRRDNCWDGTRARNSCRKPSQEI